jgi:hypothetical protein
MPILGVAEAGSIDKIGEDPETGEAVLVMLEPRPWVGTPERGYQLQEKFNTYLGFALDGEMRAAFPTLAAKSLRIQIDCVDTPDPASAHLLKLIEQQISFQGIRIAVRVVPDLAQRMLALPVASNGSSSELPE